jgi:hypothetical protein
MGGRRLPREKTLASLAILFAVALGGCWGGGDAAEPSPVPSPSATDPASATVPPPSPTPDPLEAPPADAIEAQAGLEALLRPSRFAEPCPGQLVTAWAAVCRSGDADGDGLPDAAWLIPLHQPAPQGPHPAVVFFRPGATQEIEAFAPEGSADGSILGAAIFSLADRDGAPGAELSYLVNSCSASACTSIVRIQAWDGTAWRDIGPGDDGVPAANQVTLEGEGPLSRIVFHGGKLDIAAGPTRASTRTYELLGGRYRLTRTEYDPPEYLYHAVVDADALFAAAKFDEAIRAYRAVIGAESLRDWKKETDRGEGRPALEGYALFRIAVATAALGNDPTEAIDAAIREGKEIVFSIASQEFRNGFREHGSVIAGCAEATKYLGTVGDGADTPAYIARLFDYGYANQPSKTYQDICRLP